MLERVYGWHIGIDADLANQIEKLGNRNEKGHKAR